MPKFFGRLRLSKFAAGYFLPRHIIPDQKKDDHEMTFKRSLKVIENVADR